MAAYGLGSIGPDARNAIPELTRALARGDDSVAHMADWALTQIQPKGTALVTLLRSLRYGDSFDRIAAASQFSLYGEGSAEAIPLLIRCLQDPDPEVASGAGSALVRIGPRAGPAVRALLSSENPVIRLRAMLVLDQLRPSSF